MPTNLTSVQLTKLNELLSRRADIITRRAAVKQYHDDLDFLIVKLNHLEQLERADAHISAESFAELERLVENAEMKPML